MSTAGTGESCLVDGPVGQCPGGPKKFIKATSQGTTPSQTSPSRAIFCLGVLGLLSVLRTSTTSHGGEAGLGCPSRPVPWPCFEICFWPLTKARWGSLSSEIGERSELGLSTAFSQSGSVMTVTKEVASGRTESINDLSFIKENRKLHCFLCYFNFALSFSSPPFFFFFLLKGLFVFFSGNCV